MYKLISEAHQLKHSDSHRSDQCVTLYSSPEKGLVTKEVMSRSALCTSTLKSSVRLQLKSYTCEINAMCKYTVLSKHLKYLITGQVL